RARDGQVQSRPVLQRGQGRSPQGGLADPAGNRHHGDLRRADDGPARRVLPRDRQPVRRNRALAADACLNIQAPELPRHYSEREITMARWYIIHAYSGFENKVRDAIITEAERLGLSQLVEEVEVPTETVTEVKRGKKIQVERKFMPGYVLAKLALNDDVYHLVKNTPKVTGFLGPNGKPQAIPDAQAHRMLDTKEEAAAHGPKAK